MCEIIYSCTIVGLVDRIRADIWEGGRYRHNGTLGSYRWRTRSSIFLCFDR
ncbi:hypothetical protein HanRHA438_Chr09g0404981 [Helianthus annuus]|nr:hypothetical protein HanRHA438_Chr09g0404981 [Helianthus annuus]